MIAAGMAACGGRGAAKKTAQPPVQYGFTVVAEYPHDPAAYTQGLFWSRGGSGSSGGVSAGSGGGFLVEGTGEYGRSDLRAVELETGRVVRSVALSDDFFGEGVAAFDGRIYQLTWLEKRGFIYDAASFGRIGEFSFSGEGWGLTSDGSRFYMSDGTPNITVRRPDDFSVERTIVVRSEGRPVLNINELEWIDGKIWANVYGATDILIVDPADGHVEGVVDCADLVSRLTLTAATDVMNGIAYNAVDQRIFVTGKRWNKLFEIEIFKK